MWILRFFSILAVGLILTPLSADAWGTPDPIALDIPNIEQETNYWCWAALIQDIIAARKIGQPPRQCQLVNSVNAKRGAASSDCCLSSGDPNCDRMANKLEIQDLVKLYGGQARAVKIPGSPEEVYDYLVKGEALICGVQIQNQHHIYLVRGISWKSGQAVLLVNDPATGGHSKEIRFDEAQPAWMLALAVS